MKNLGRVYRVNKIKFLINNQPVIDLRKNVSRYLNKDKSSKAIRECFLDYFINECNHNFIRSSPVIPFCDPSVAFVNAGMNQFKSIFLGTQIPKYKKVANSQKCIRVGGKHNDINVVGQDGYHHTFFEMLGNWSFGDYFKKEACQMAWNLLTQRYKINKDILYVTYFGGDDSLQLEADLECRDIWKTIGVSDDRILPFGIKDNFWEMGFSGPCGPCTEIHVDLLGSINRSKFINKGLPDLTELWNIVFIQYNRYPDGSIHVLPQKHVDTGMGLERLTTLLQGKISNYDTDIFTNLFIAINKICKGVPTYEGKFGEKDWDNLDANYRILADHIRTVTVCLADGIIPEENQKLRRIIRKTFLISDMIFKRESGLIEQLSNYVVENLGHAYPELERNIAQVHQIIHYEEQVYKSLRNNSVLEWEKIIKEEPKFASLDVIEMPGLIAACKEIRLLPNKSITPEFGFKLYDTHGLDEEMLTKLSRILNMSFDVRGFRNALTKAKFRSRVHNDTNKIVYNDLIKENVQPTQDFYKYDYEKETNHYIFKSLQVQLLKVINNNMLVTNIEPNKECNIILNKTNFYTESGGQCSDIGSIKFQDGIFEISNTHNLNGFIAHTGILLSNKLKSIPINSLGNLKINEESRLNNMRNHTATHLLNAKIKQLKGATCQKSSKVTAKYLNFDVGIFGSKLSTEDLGTIEVEINEIIKSGLDVVTTEIDSQKLLDINNITLVPGEIYPHKGIRIIEINGPENFQSIEPCCGTHVLNTADIEDFCIIGCQSLGRSTASLYAVTGSRARLARKNGTKLLENVMTLDKNVNDNMDKPEIISKAVKNLKNNLKYDMENNLIIPVIVKDQCLEILNNINKRIKDIAKNSLKEFIKMEMQNVLSFIKNDLKNRKKYLVHYLACSTMLDSVPLQNATKLCQDLPILVISYSDNTVKARCCVPEKMVNENFNAEKWLKNTLIPIFKSDLSKSKGYSSTLICNMKTKKINIKDWDTLLQKSLESAKSYAEKHLK